MKQFLLACLILTLAISQAQANDGKVLFQFYFESLCPGCYDYLTSAWKTALYTPDLVTLFELKMYPYGFASEYKYGPTYKFICQHGPSECEGNQVETCIIHEVDWVTAGKAIICLEEQQKEVERWDYALDACALQFGFSYQNVVDCTQSIEGHDLQDRMAVETDKLVPEMQYVPWLVVDEVFKASDLDEVYENPVKYICENYSGPASDVEKVAACAEYISKNQIEETLY